MTGVKGLTALVVFFVMSIDHAAAQTPHRCAENAQNQGAKLLEFHAGSGDRIYIDDTVKVMAPLRNPVNRQQLLEVIEIWGYIYKGRYRMRFIYAPVKNHCVLMGQELLEYANP